MKFTSLLIAQACLALAFGCSAPAPEQAEQSTTPDPLAGVMVQTLSMHYAGGSGRSAGMAFLGEGVVVRSSHSWDPRRDENFQSSSRGTYEFLDSGELRIDPTEGAGRAAGSWEGTWLRTEDELLLGAVLRVAPNTWHFTSREWSSPEESRDHRFEIEFDENRQGGKIRLWLPGYAGEERVFEVRDSSRPNAFRLIDITSEDGWFALPELRLDFERGFGEKVGSSLGRRTQRCPIRRADELPPAIRLGLGLTETSSAEPSEEDSAE